MSPAVLRPGPYRFYFVSHDLHEPPHVPIDRDAFSAKFWLNLVTLAHILGFPARELRKLEALTAEHREDLLEACLRVEARVPQSEETDSQLEDSGLDLMPYKWGKYRVRLTRPDLATHEALVVGLLRRAYEEREA